MSMPQEALKDLYRYLHFIDDWENENPASNTDSEDGEWDADCVFLHPKVEALEDTAKHQTKFSVLEDAYNKWWQEIVHFGKWVTMDKSRVAGWYHSMMMIGPEPKPICTGATIHLVCVTEGKFRMFKIVVSIYGGQYDSKLNDKHHEVQKKVKGL